MPGDGAETIGLCIHSSRKAIAACRIDNLSLSCDIDLLQSFNIRHSLRDAIPKQELPHLTNIPHQEQNFSSLLF